MATATKEHLCTAHAWVKALTTLPMEADTRGNSLMAKFQVKGFAIFPRRIETEMMNFEKLSTALRVVTAK